MLNKYMTIVHVHILWTRACVLVFDVVPVRVL